jgi:adenine deaminase
MTVYIREGSAAKDLEALLPAVSPSNARSFCLCTDDLQAGDLLLGSIDQMIRKAVGLGLEPVTAVRMATLNPALHFGLRGKGAIAPGYDADLVVIDSFDRLTVEMVFKKGRLVARGGRVRVPVRHIDHPSTKNTVHIPEFDVSRVRLKARGVRARVIELIPHQIETRQAVLPIRARAGFVISDRSRDILKLLVVERHRSSGNIGFGLVKGFGLSSGALASTIAHDSHNIIAVGVDDADIHKAVVEIGRMHGGMVVVDRGKVLARLPLPVAGLMSEKSAHAVAKKIDEVRQAAQRLGARIEEPFSALSFLALPVIPDLKLTDRGLVDVNRFTFVDLFV